MKFNIGDKVKVTNDGEVGEVVGIHATVDNVTYTITSKEVDLANKQILNGVKTCSEDELEGVKNEE